MLRNVRACWRAYSPGCVMVVNFWLRYSAVNGHVTLPPIGPISSFQQYFSHHSYSSSTISAGTSNTSFSSSTFHSVAFLWISPISENLVLLIIEIGTGRTTGVINEMAAENWLSN